MALPSPSRQKRRSFRPSAVYPSQGRVVQDCAVGDTRRLRIWASDTPSLGRLPPSLPLLRAISEAGVGPLPSRGTRRPLRGKTGIHSMTNTAAI